MKNRQLSEQEIEICKKSIERKKTRNERLGYFICYLTKDMEKLVLDLKGGLKVKIEMKLEELDKEAELMQNEINSNEEQIKILNDQITNGVKPKGKGGKW